MSILQECTIRYVMSSLTHKWLITFEPSHKSSISLENVTFKISEIASKCDVDKFHTANKHALHSKLYTFIILYFIYQEFKVTFSLHVQDARTRLYKVKVQ